MVYIIGEKGFYVGRKLIKKGKDVTFISNWTTILKDATHFTTKTAKKIILKEGGVIWKPYEEYSNLGLNWKVEFIEKCFGDESYIPHYDIVRDYNHSNDSDVKFLNRKGTTLKKLYSKEDAEKIALEKNKNLIEELKNISYGK